MWQAVDINYWSLTLIRRQGQEVDVNELHLSCNKLWYIWYACLARLPIPSNFHIFIIYRLRYPDEWKALQLTTSANAKIPLNKSPTWRHNLFRFLQIRKWLLGPPSQSLANLPPPWAAILVKKCDFYGMLTHATCLCLWYFMPARFLKTTEDK